MGSCGGIELEGLFKALVAMEPAEGGGVAVGGALMAGSLLDPSASRQ